MSAILKGRQQCRPFLMRAKRVLTLPVIRAKRQETVSLADAA
jgi:hypothetical protein